MKPYAGIFDAPQWAAIESGFHYRRVVHLESAPSERFEGLFPWSRLNDLLTLNLLDDERLRVVRDSRPVPPVLFRRDNKRRRIDAGKLTDLLMQGASLNITRVQDLAPEIRYVAAAIERRLDLKVNVNAYLSMAHGGAFAAHYDTHDVLVLQVHGSKLWSIYDDPEAHPLLEHKVPSRKAVGTRAVGSEVHLQQGEILFVPRGVYHKAAVQGEASVHLTFGLHTTKGIDLVDMLRERATRIEDFRRDLSSVIGRESLESQERTIKDRLHALVEDLSLEELFGRHRGGRLPYDIFRLGPEPDADPAVALLARVDSAAAPRAVLDDPLAVQIMQRLNCGGQMTLSALAADLCEPDATSVRVATDILVGARLAAYL